MNKVNAQANEIKNVTNAVINDANIALNNAYDDSMNHFLNEDEYLYNIVAFSDATNEIEKKVGKYYLGEHQKKPYSP